MQTKNKIDIPNGIYLGSVSGNELTILSNSFFNKKFELSVSVKGLNIPVIVVASEGVLKCYNEIIEATLFDSVKNIKVSIKQSEPTELESAGNYTFIETENGFMPFEFYKGSDKK